MLKKVLIGLAAVAVAVGLWYAKDKKHIDAFTHILPSYYAKEYCSCRWVMNRDVEFCHNHARQFLPISSFTQDSEKKKVTVKALGSWASAEWVGQRQGCQLK